MKTRLLLLFFTLLFSVFSFSQITFSNLTSSNITNTTATVSVTLSNLCTPSQYRLQYSTSSTFLAGTIEVVSSTVNNGLKSHNLTGLLANTPYYFRFYVSPGDASACNSTEIVSATASFTTSNTQFTFSNLTSSLITPNSARVSVALSNVCAGAGYRLQYATSSAFGAGTIEGLYQGGTDGVKDHDLTGLTPNTLYYFRFYASPNQACNTSQIVSATASFTTSGNPTLIAEYNFNNTYNNVNGNTPFTSNTGTSFTTDRNGNANSALNLVSIGTSATIPNLPYGSSPRTISIWVKNYSYNWFVASACPFSYGTTANAYELAMYETQFKLNPYPGPFAAHNVNLTPLNITNALNTWNHYLVSYDGTTSKIYKDGVLLSSSNIALTTANNSDIFRLGLLNFFTSDYFDGAIDDLKIYNYALTDAEVTSLYASNTLSTTNFSKNNLQASVYPNPTNDILNIQMEKELKTATIYTVLGNQVLVSTNKQINVASLSSGNYLVRIEAVDGAVTTQKIIIK